MMLPLMLPFIFCDVLPVVSKENVVRQTPCHVRAILAMSQRTRSRVTQMSSPFVQIPATIWKLHRLCHAMTQQLQWMMGYQRRVVLTQQLQAMMGYQRPVIFFPARAYLQFFALLQAQSEA